MCIIQLLLGNMGIAGGGINAMRGEGNVQGSTDYGLLFHILPGYLPVPSASVTALPAYIEKFTPKTKEPKSVNWWSNRGKYITSYLKAIYGDKAKKENDFGYAWLPKIDEGMNASWLMLFDQMNEGKFEGFFAWGQNPACSGANSNKTRQALSKLKWMVNVNLFDNETGSFWKGPGMNPKDVQTEVFLLPAASSVEKEGSLSNSGRWAQWRYKAIDPIGQSKPDSDIMNELYFRVKRLYQKQGGKFPEPILNLTWNYGEKDAQGKVKEVNIHNVAKEINGYYLQDVYDKTATPPKLLGKKGDLCASFVHLQMDGSTSCGCWIYSQSYTQKEGKIINMMARRGKADPTGLGLYPEWSWAWPVNRRIIYNRASVDPQGKPWDPKRAVVKWDPVKEDPASKKPGTWVGDVPDGPAPPMATEKGKLPFIMMATGVGALFGPGLTDGPFPEHYEALECPLEENSMSKQRINPTIKLFGGKDDAFFSCDVRYPFVATTYRVSEHWQTGVMTRHQSWQLEMQPQMFVEMSEELAKDKGISNGEKVIVKSGRGEVKAVAIVTSRFKPFKVAGSTVHQVGLPWHFGWQFPEDGSGGDSANLLTPNVGDANTMIPESKAFMVNVVKA
jgi:formate dehydrogenase major subunit